VESVAEELVDSLGPVHPQVGQGVLPAIVVEPGPPLPFAFWLGVSPLEQVVSAGQVRPLMVAAAVGRLQWLELGREPQPRQSAAGSLRRLLGRPVSLETPLEPVLHQELVE